MIEQITKEDNIIKAIKTTLSGNHSDIANRILAKIEFFTSEIKEVFDDWEDYKNSKINRFMIFRPKKREIEYFSIRDRIIHKAIWNVVHPVLEKKFVKSTYACIKDRGGFKASRDLYKHINKNPNQYYLKIDVKSYYSSIHKPTLFKILSKKIKCKATLHLLKVIMWYNDDDRGIPVGSVLSQTFGNFYLSKLDNMLVRRGLRCFRYMDDMILVHEDKERLKETLIFIEDFLKTALSLELNNRTVLNKIKNGINFVGYIHYPRFVRIRRATALKIKRNISELNKASYFGLLMHGNNYKLLQLYEEKINGKTGSEVEVESRRQDNDEGRSDNDQWSLFPL
ncbi:MAG: reverse transcriptase/maturase family protein [Brevinema sp.]